MGSEKKNPQYVEFLAEDTKLGADDAAVLPGRLDRYSKAHHRALAMSDYAMTRSNATASVELRRNYVKIASRLRSCGNYLLFRDYYTVGKVRLHAAKFCKKHLLCPFCAIRRGAKMLKSYIEKTQVIISENPNLKAYFVTLTVKDGEDLEERFLHLASSLMRMHAVRRRMSQGQFNESCKALASVWSFEFKRGKNSGEWHPHVHMIWLCEQAPDAFKLSAEWFHFTGDSFIVDVRPFYDQDDMLGGFLEVFKYAVKFSDLPLEDNWNGYEVLGGKRLIASAGLFRGIEIPDDLSDEPLDELPYVESLYEFVFGAGYSHVRQHRQLAPEQGLVRGRGSVQVAPPLPYKKGRSHLLYLRKKHGLTK